MSWAAVN